MSPMVLAFAWPFRCMVILQGLLGPELLQSSMLCVAGGLCSSFCSGMGTVEHLLSWFEIIGPLAGIPIGGFIMVSSCAMGSAVPSAKSLSQTCHPFARSSFNQSFD